MSANTKTAKTATVTAPKGTQNEVKKERTPMLSYSVFAKLPENTIAKVAGIVRKTKTKISATGEAQVFVGEFAYTVGDGPVIKATRAILPAKIAAGFPATIDAPLAFSFTYSNKTGSFVRTPSIFSVSVLLP